MSALSVSFSPGGSRPCSIACKPCCRSHTVTSSDGVSTSSPSSVVEIGSLWVILHPSISQKPESDQTNGPMVDSVTASGKADIRDANEFVHEVRGVLRDPLAFPC